jgi:hypothetical protein
MRDMVAGGMRAGADPAHAAADRRGEVGHRADHRRIAHQLRQASGGIARGNRQDIAAGGEMVGIVGKDIVDQLRFYRGNYEVEALVGDRCAVGYQRNAIGNFATRGIDDSYRFRALDPLRK